MDGYLTSMDVARITGRSVCTVRRWAARGKLAAARLAGREYLFTPAAVEALLAPVRPRGGSRAARRRRYEAAVAELRAAGYSIGPVG